MEDRDAAVRRLEAAVLDGPATAPPALRRAVAAGEAPQGPVRDWAEVVDAGGQRATAAGLAALRAAGLDDDAAFDVTVAAAVGAGLRRLRAGLALLERT